MSEKRWPLFIVSKEDLKPGNFLCDSKGYPYTTVFKSAEGHTWVFSELPVGAMWVNTAWGDYTIKLPNGCDWNPWHTYQGHKWTVVGDPPFITTYPSINCPGRYHGWVKDGYVTEDVEGRKFNNIGEPL